MEQRRPLLFVFLSAMFLFLTVFLIRSTDNDYLIIATFVGAFGLFTIKAVKYFKEKYHCNTIPLVAALCLGGIFLDLIVWTVDIFALDGSDFRNNFWLTSITLATIIVSSMYSLKQSN